jgi:Mg2+/Co2+ transporter CorC
VDFTDRDEDTIGGVVMSELGRMPEAGDAVELPPLHLEVLAVEGNRVQAVRGPVLTPTPATPP